jgi:hypothetical protein
MPIKLQTDDPATRIAIGVAKRWPDKELMFVVSVVDSNGTYHEASVPASSLSNLLQIQDVPIEKVVPTSKSAVDWVLRGPRCRDCADYLGICEQTGLPCDPTLARRAARHVIERVNYGLSEGYIEAPKT